MTVTHGFRLLEERHIHEIDSRARLFRHEATGAELLSLENEDENKVFGINFRTPVTDSTGLPHILEHSVLCGSRNYPIKEPFVELMKGSLHTFLNAFTYPDKTCYPVASQNLQDFYNLIDVYLDAVFFPRLTPQVLQQEGWHYELDDASQPLTFKGVVFNEMKGANASPERVLSHAVQESIFPDITYAHDSGGDPEKIPDLTWEQFKSFHEQYYHPSNARIFFYGDDPAEERLHRMDEVLRQFDQLESDSTVGLQQHFDEPKWLVRPYAVTADNGSGDNKAMVAVSWLLPEVVDVDMTLALQLLDYILVQTPASPLRRALIESGLGEDLAGHGVEAELRQMLFSTGLKGIDEEKAGAVESLILETLESLAKEGIDPDMIEAAVNTVEFSLRENNTGSYPRGLLLMLRSLTTWLHGGNPFAPLAFEAPLARIKQRLAEGERLFESLIERYFLQNPHRTTVVLKPDPDLARQREEAEQARLDAARSGMGELDVQRVIQETHALRLAQETPDTPEALATIPRLGLADLERENKLIPLAVLDKDGTRLLYHDLFTNGIAYLDVGLDLSVLPQDLLPYVPLLGRAFLEIGTDREDFARLSRRIDRETGGIRSELLAAPLLGSVRGTTWLFLRGKALMPQVNNLLAILRDVLLTVRLDNRDRFRQMVLEDKAGAESALIPGGHRVVNRRLRAHFTQGDWATEQMGGTSQLFFLRRLAQEVESDWPSVLERLEQVRELLVRRGNMLCNVTLDNENWQYLEPELDTFLSDIPSGAGDSVEWSPVHASTREGLVIPAAVNYVGKAARLYDLGYDLNGSAIVISRYLRASWLWERVRVQGGAYGGFSLFDTRSGVFSYLSYRDPNLLNTLEVYDQTADYLRRLELSDQELVGGIIGAIGEMDAYLLPDARGWVSMERYLTGVTDEVRQRLRDEILSTTSADFRAFADVLDDVAARGHLVVMGSQANLDAANERLAPPLDILKLL